jgi:hypothetical protein
MAETFPFSHLLFLSFFKFAVWAQTPGGGGGFCVLLSMSGGVSVISKGRGGRLQAGYRNNTKNTQRSQSERHSTRLVATSPSPPLRGSFTSSASCNRNATSMTDKANEPRVPD